MDTPYTVAVRTGPPEPVARTTRTAPPAGAARADRTRAAYRPAGDGPGRRSGRRRHLGRAAAVLVAVCAACLFVGVVGVVGVVGFLADDGGGGDRADASKAVSGSGDTASGPDGRDRDGADRSPEGYVACARLIAEGTVERVDRVPGRAEDRIRLRVERYYKPAHGEPEVTFVMDASAGPRPRAGDRALIGFARGEVSPDIWSTGMDIVRDRAWIVRALPGADGMPCS